LVWAWAQRKARQSLVVWWRIWHSSYPSVAVTPDNSKLLVGVGKGNQSKPNPIPKVEKPESELTETEKAIKSILPYPYIGTTLSGTLSVVDMPSEEQLNESTQQV